MWISVNYDHFFYSKISDRSDESSTEKWEII